MTARPRPAPPPTAAIYVRVSSDRQAEEGTSLATQEAACRAFVAQLGAQLDERHVYREVWSGASLWERPRLAELRQAVADRLIGTVVAYAIDRLTRDAVHLGVLLTEADRVGCGVQFVTEKLDDTPEGALIRSVRGYAAQVERVKILERTQRGRAARLAAGKLLPGRRPRYGYRWTDATHAAYAIDPLTAPIVQRVFRELLAGGTLRGIAAGLSRDAVPTPAGAVRWHASTLATILADGAYAGSVHPNRWRTGSARPDGTAAPAGGSIAVPPLVSAEDQARAQTVLARNRRESTRRASHPERALLRAGYVYCDHCQRPAIARPNAAGYHLYLCNPNGVTGGCRDPRPQVSAAAADAIAWSRVREVVLSPALIAKATADVARTDRATASAPARAQVERQLADVVGRVDRLVASLEAVNDAETRATIHTRLAALGAERDRLRAELPAAAELDRAADLRSRAVADLAQIRAATVRVLDDLDYAGKRDLLAALGVRAYVRRAGEQPRVFVRTRFDDVAEGGADSLVS